MKTIFYTRPWPGKQGNMESSFREKTVLNNKKLFNIGCHSGLTMFIS